jgi:hypothetical protein
MTDLGGQAQVPKRRSRREAMTTSVQGMGLRDAEEEEEEEEEVLEAEVFGSSHEDMVSHRTAACRKTVNYLSFDGV